MITLFLSVLIVKIKKWGHGVMMQEVIDEATQKIDQVNLCITRSTWWF